MKLHLLIPFIGSRSITLAQLHQAKLGLSLTSLDAIQLLNLVLRCLYLDSLNLISNLSIQNNINFELSLLVLLIMSNEPQVFRSSLFFVVVSVNVISKYSSKSSTGKSLHNFVTTTSRHIIELTRSLQLISSFFQIIL